MTSRRLEKQSWGGVKFFLQVGDMRSLTMNEHGGSPIGKQANTRQKGGAGNGMLNPYEWMWFLSLLSPMDITFFSL